MTTRIAFVIQNNHVLHMTIPAAQYVWKTNHALIDRSSFDQFEIDNCDVNWADFDIVIPFGSVQFIRNMRGTVLNEHIFFREESFVTSEWMRHFGDSALNSHGRVYSARDVSSLFGGEPSAKFHIRPNSKDKAFIADVFSRDGWENVVAERTVDPDLDCFVSPVCEVMHAEYRCWIVGGQVVEVSRYRQSGIKDFAAVDSTHEAWVTAQQLAAMYLPEDCIVMDLVQTDDGYKFLEFNSIHSSGWYAGNIATIFNAMVQWLTDEKHKAE